MNRRTLLKTMGLSTSALLLVAPQLAFSDETGSGELTHHVTIDFNHGHDFAVLTLNQLIVLLREVHTQGPKQFSIQGSSRHDHTIEITTESLIQLLVEGKTEFTSSSVGGHSHPVAFELL